MTSTITTDGIVFQNLPVDAKVAGAAWFGMMKPDGEAHLEFSMEKYEPTARSRAALEALVRAGLIREAKDEPTPGAVRYYPLVSFKPLLHWWHVVSNRDALDFTLVEPIHPDDERTFDFTFTDVGFTSGGFEEIDEAEYLKLAAAKLKEVGIDDLTITSVSHGTDDSVYENGEDENGDVKVFVTITVRAGFSAADAGNVSEPSDLNDDLEQVFEALCGDLDMEGNWEVLEYEEIRATVTLEVAA